jgi:WD repeat-containing protein 19
MQALDALQTSGGDAQVQQACVSGMARSLLHLGDLRGGKALAQQINSSSLWKECAAILEQMHQNQDAAEMYEQAGMAEKAAGIYIAARNWAAAAPLMQRVTSAKLQLQYAKAKEGEGSYADAVAAYEAAGGCCTGSCNSACVARCVLWDVCCVDRCLLTL